MKKYAEIKCPCPYEDAYIGICNACQHRHLRVLSDIVKINVNGNYVYHLRV